VCVCSLCVFVYKINPVKVLINRDLSPHKTSVTLADVRELTCIKMGWFLIVCSSYRISRKSVI
jgi:hypothetical protein